jgi:PucR C-terminal helix-turn-helix domain/GGDEF-like domain
MIEVVQSALDGAPQQTQESGPAGQVAAIAASLTERLPQLTDETLSRILREVPDLRGDEAVEELLAAGARESIATGIDVVAHAIDVGRVEPPPAASEYTRRLAQRGVPVEALLRAYRIGHASFLERCLIEVADRRLSGPDVVAVLDVLTRWSFAFIDRMSEQLIGVYVGERDRWLQNASRSRAALVRAVLAGEVGDIEHAEAALRYRLRRPHVGLVAWLEPVPTLGEGPRLLDRFSAALVASRAQPPLIVMADETSLWAWLPADGPEPITEAALARMIGDAAGEVRAAIGTPAEGVEGFRSTHEQALRAQGVAAAGGPHGAVVTSFREASLVAFLTADVDDARVWVQGVLGPLAGENDAAGRLRETVRVFLQTKGSFTETAARMHLHRNTVHYRVRKAEELRGRPLDDDRLEVEVALLACRRLGATVLSV